MKKVLATLVLCLVGCTDNQMAKKFGGTTEVKISEKLVNVTWKDDSMWILTRDKKDADTKDTYHFQEKSSWGLLQGKVTIIEE